MKKTIALLSVGLTVMFSSCQETSRSKIPEESTADTAVLKEDEGLAINDADLNNDVSMAEWNGYDYNLPTLTLPEITVVGLDVRGNDRFTSYSVDESVFFDTDQATLRSTAEESLQQIASSINQRYIDGKIRIYGYADKRASENYNKELSEQRAQAVKQWLVSQGNIEASRISIHPMGETAVAADTQAGMQQNRRVDIVVMNSASNTDNN